MSCLLYLYQHNKFEFLKFCLIDNFEAIMVNKCSAIGCLTSYKGHNTGAVFGLPKEEDLRLRWITFLHRNDVSKLINIFIRERHFDDTFLNKNGKRTRLIISKQPLFLRFWWIPKRSSHRQFSQQYRRLENLLKTSYKTQENPTSTIWNFG